MKIRKTSKQRAAMVLFRRQFSRRCRMSYDWGPRSPQQSLRLAQRIVGLMQARDEGPATLARVDAPDGQTS